MTLAYIKAAIVQAGGLHQRLQREGGSSAGVLLTAETSGIAGIESRFVGDVHAQARAPTQARVGRGFLLRVGREEAEGAGGTQGDGLAGVNVIVQPS